MKQRHSSSSSGVRPRRAFKLAAAALFFMALVWQHVQATRLGYQVEQARQRILALRCVNGALRMELESILSPAHLCALARGRMGMSLAAPESLRRLEASAPAGPRPGFLRHLISRTRQATLHT